MRQPPTIVGDLSAEDEFMHPVTDDPSFSESMMFNFFDNARGLGGFVRIGNRLNEGHAEMTLCLFLPNGRLLLQWAKPSIDSNCGFEAAGMRFRVLEPGRRLEVTYRGPGVCIADPDEMVNPGKAMRSNPTMQVHLSVIVSAAGPLIGSATGNRHSAVIFLDGVGHYQQPISADGSLSAGHDHWPLSAMVGVRDHSWGRRVWSSLYRDRSLWIAFDHDLAFICCKTWLSPEAPPDVMGCVVKGGSVTPLGKIGLESRFRPGTHYHDSIQLELEDTDHRRYSLTGEVISYVPLRHRSPVAETVFLGQAMTRFKFEDRETFGLSEYFDAASACPALVGLSRHGATVRE